MRPVHLPAGRRRNPPVGARERARATPRRRSGRKVFRRGRSFRRRASRSSEWRARRRQQSSTTGVVDDRRLPRGGRHLAGPPLQASGARARVPTAPRSSIETERSAVPPDTTNKEIEWLMQIHSRRNLRASSGRSVLQASTATDLLLRLATCVVRLTSRWRCNSRDRMPTRAACWRESPETVLRELRADPHRWGRPLVGGALRAGGHVVRRRVPGRLRRGAAPGRRARRPLRPGEPRGRGPLSGPSRHLGAGDKHAGVGVTAALYAKRRSRPGTRGHVVLGLPYQHAAPALAERLAASHPGAPSPRPTPSARRGGPERRRGGGGGGDGGGVGGGRGGDGDADGAMAASVARSLAAGRLLAGGCRPRSRRRARRGRVALRRRRRRPDPRQPGEKIFARTEVHVCAPRRRRRRRGRRRRWRRRRWRRAV